MASQLPETMRAAVVDRAGPPENIYVTQVPVPRLKRDHVIIALDYASLGGWDSAQRSGTWGKIKAGTILGVDGSGHVAAVASDVTRLRVGDRVYSYAYENPDGGFHAEYVSVRADLVDHVPAHLDQKVAGAIPCVGLTAQSGLRVLKTKPNDELLVYGATGGVGSLAVWLGANPIGAAVIGTARSDAQEYLRTLGAAHAIDPHSSEREALIKRAAPEGFAAALVTADGDDLLSFLRYLRPKASFAYPNGVEPEPSIEGHRALAFDGEMSREAFQLFNTAIGSRTIPLRIQEFALDEVVEAHRRIEQRHVIGKIVLRIR